MPLAAATGAFRLQAAVQQPEDADGDQINGHDEVEQAREGTVASNGKIPYIVSNPQAIAAAVFRFWSPCVVGGRLAPFPAKGVA